MALISLSFMAKNNEYIFTLKTKQNKTNQTPKTPGPKFYSSFKKKLIPNL